MNVIQITPGTGNFHCGSCMRDAALVMALRRLGHDVRCVPLYLPFVTEEDRQRLARLIERHEIETLHTLEPSLESVFLKLTGRGLY